MKIGILTYRQYPYVSANTAIGYLLGESIKKNSQYDILFIGHKQSEEQNDIEEYHNIQICFLNEYSKVDSKIICLINKIKGILGKRVFYKKEAKKLKEIVEKHEIDILISVIAPISTALISYVAKLNIPILLYQLDPFYNLNDIEDLKLKKTFIKILSAFEKLYTTDLLYNGYLQDESIKKYKEKMQIVHFPKIVEYSADKRKNETHKKIRMIYGGTLYRKIRNPLILLELKKRLSINCEIIFLGKCDVIEDQEMLEQSDIICKGFCSQEELRKEVNEADILINIGNTVKNQLGSKLIEYIATGKPILNIYQFKGCPTLNVLEKYPYKFNILANDIHSSSNKILEMNKFIFEVKDKRENFAKIKDIYKEYTPEYVSKVLIDDIQIIKNKGKKNNV